MIEKRQKGKEKHIREKRKEKKRCGSRQRKKVET